MGVKLRPLYMGLVLFAFVFTMYNAVHFDVNDRYNVENNQTVSVKEEYEQLENNVQSNDDDNKGLIEKLKTLRNPLDDPFATIGAGLFIVPQVIGLLTAPLDIGESIISSLGSAFAGFLSPKIPSFIYIALAVTVAFGLLELYLRMNEA